MRKAYHGTCGGIYEIPIAPPLEIAITDMRGLVILPLKRRPGPAGTIRCDALPKPGPNRGDCCTLLKAGKPKMEIPEERLT